MKLFGANDWILLNDIIYRIYSTEDLVEMQKTFLDLIKLLIPYERATFYLSGKEDSHLLNHPVAVNLQDEELQEYMDIFEGIDYTRWIYICAKSVTFRDTDLFSDSVREETPYYKEVYEPLNIHFSAQLSIAYKGVFLGVISFFRSKNNSDFTDENLFVLDMLKDHLAYRLYKDSIKNETESNKQHEDFDINAFSVKYNLTKREVDVLKLIVEGLTNDEIYTKLYISSHTLKKHIMNIYKKLNVKNRLQLYKLIGK